MKKLVLLFAMVMAFAVASQAQMSFGAKAGFNMATISGDMEDTKMKPGFQIGGVANFGLSDAFAVQPSLILSNKGVKIEGEGFTATAGLNYLEVPVNAVYNVGGFQIYAGPYLGVGLFGKVKFDEDEVDDITVKFKNDVAPDDVAEDETYFSMLDFGLNFGIGYKVMDNIQVQAGYGLGLANINPKFDGEDPEDTDTNSVIQLTVSYFLQ